MDNKYLLLLHFVKEKMQAKGIRHSSFLGRPIKKVAVLGGSGSFAISQAIQAGATGVAAGSLFVFRDIKKAVLINYPTEVELKSLNSLCGSEL